MPKYFITIPNSVTLPTDGNKVALTSACELHRDDSGVPNALTVAAAGAYNMFVADAPGTGTATAPDVTAPTLLSTSPADNATGVAVGATIDLVFSETVVLGTGNIVLRDNDGGWAALESFNAATGSGDNGGTLTLVTTTETNDTVRITPGANLANSIEHAVQVAATAVDDTSGNSFAGIADDTTVSFTTAAAAGGNPAIVGGAGSATRTFGTTLNVPLHADSAEGQTGIVVIAAKGTARTVNSLPAGWSQLGTRQTIATDTYADVFTGPITPGQETAEVAAFGFDGNYDCHGLSITLDSGNPTNFSAGSGAGGSPVTCPSITVGAGSASVGFGVIASVTNYTSMSPAEVATSLPTGSPSRSLCVTAVTGESAGASSAISFLFPGGPAWISISLEVEPA